MYKVFMCNICQKVFRLEEALKVHQKAHSMANDGLASTDPDVIEIDDD